MKPQTTNILIIDDHEIIMEGLKKRLKEVFEDVNCYFANNGRIAISLLTKHDIDLVICDLNFRNETGPDGFEIIKTIKSLKPKVKTIAYTSFDSYRIMKKTLESGFDSFLDKGCSFKDFSQTVKGLLAQGKFESDTMKRLKKKRKEDTKSIYGDSYFGIYNLSKRQIELILNCIHTTDRMQLAEMMHITPSTIDTHFSRILDKLDISHRKEIALFAQEFKNELEQLLNH